MTAATTIMDIMGQDAEAQVTVMNTIEAETLNSEDKVKA